MAAIAPYQKDGKWYIDKDANDERYYVANIANDLADSATTAASVEAILGGVVKLEEADLQGHLIVIKLGGLDTAANAKNFWTSRVTCANGEKFDRTIWFNGVEN